MQEENQSDETINIGKNVPNKPYSMLSEIEHELRLRFQAHDNLPGKPVRLYLRFYVYIVTLSSFSDIALESKRKSMSADPLPHDSASITSRTGSSTSRGYKYIQEDSYGGYCPKADKSKPTTVGYETIVSFFLYRNFNFKFKKILYKSSCNTLRNEIRELI